MSFEESEKQRETSSAFSFGTRMSGLGNKKNEISESCDHVTA